MKSKTPNSNLFKFLLDNVQSGDLKIYGPVDFYFEEPQTNFDELLADGAPVSEAPYNPAQNYYVSEKVSYKGKIYSSNTNDNKGLDPSDPKNSSYWVYERDVVNLLKPESMTSIQMVEDVIFDKRRSRLYYDIVGFIITDQNNNPRGMVNYKEFVDLVEKKFHSKNMRERSTVLWKNRYNPSEDKSYVDALKLRLFHGVVSKVENPDDLDMSTIYQANKRSYTESVFARWEEEMKMMEKEHNLWEY
jgi:Gliding motility associated protein GldN